MNSKLPVIMLASGIALLIALAIGLTAYNHASGQASQPAAYASPPAPLPPAPVAVPQPIARTEAQAPLPPAPPVSPYQSQPSRPSPSITPPNNPNTATVAYLQSLSAIEAAREMFCRQDNSELAPFTAALLNRQNVDQDRMNAAIRDCKSWWGGLSQRLAALLPPQSCQSLHQHYSSALSAVGDCYDTIIRAEGTSDARPEADAITAAQSDLDTIWRQTGIQPFFAIRGTALGGDQPPEPLRLR